jgi:hypothetical protein
LTSAKPVWTCGEFDIVLLLSFDGSLLIIASKAVRNDPVSGGSDQGVGLPKKRETAPVRKPMKCDAMRPIEAWPHENLPLQPFQTPYLLKGDG